MPKSLLIDGQMHLYGDVGDPFGFGDGFTGQDVAQSLSEHGAKPITVRINSPGGLAYEGMAIHSLLKAHPAPVTTAVDGVAASAASLIAMAGMKREMRDGAMLMVHDPAARTIGNEATHRKAADKLNMLADNYANVYGTAAKMPKDQARALMRDETWMSADDAVAKGFATAKIAEPAVAFAPFDYRLYAHAPENLPLRKLAELADAAVTMFAGAEIVALMAASADWRVGADRGLAVDPRGAWDGGAAAKRMLDAAGFATGAPDSGKARKGFLIYDAGNANERGSYKLPFADIIGGKLVAIAGGLRAAASRLPQTDVPQSVRDEARRVLDAYFAKLGGNKTAASARMRLSAAFALLD